MTDEAPPHFAPRLIAYLSQIKSAGREAGRAFLFLEFIRAAFRGVDPQYLENLYPELEKFVKLRSKTLVIRGRIDALLGNLIIEFEENLGSPKLQEAASQLQKYVAILWSMETKIRTQYLALATDGERFVVYRPRTIVPSGQKVLPKDVTLDEIDKINLHPIQVADAYIWFDRYILHRTRRPAKADEFANEFGLNKPAFKESVGPLLEEWKSLRETTLYDQWASFLRIVYGSGVDSEELFLKHTYLATLAKLIAYSTFSGGAMPVSDEQIRQILEGTTFREKWGIHNFVDEDFFAWVPRNEMGLNVARMLLARLSVYELSTVDEDILKALYQDLVDPNDRHVLGEYYTPDWLAEYVIEQVIDQPKKSILDPSCGSGTFLAASIRKKKSELAGILNPTQLLDHILESVQGVDVHPLAIILARTTYLVSLGRDLLNARRGAVSFPVYMADSIRLPEEDLQSLHGVEGYKIKADKQFLWIPRKIAEDPQFTDRSMEIVRDLAKSMSNGEAPEGQAFTDLLFRRMPPLQEEPDGKVLSKVLFETSQAMSELIKKHRDTVWAFILKNIYKPLFLKNHKFDVVLGNPPWISYRYIESTDYQKFLKHLITDDYGLLPSARAELITQLEIATLFFLRCAELYLKERGTIAFVMPRAIFVSDQHDAFRSGSYKSDVHIKKLVDLEDLVPLFKVPTCVVIGHHGPGNSHILGARIEGKLPQKNMHLSDISKYVVRTDTSFQLYRIGERSFLESLVFADVVRAMEAGERSPYYKSFSQGATIFPREAWFVEPDIPPMGGIDPTIPPLKTSRRAVERAKEEYKDVFFEGSVEDRFLYATVTGSELVPFGHLDLPLCVLPIESELDRFRILDSQAAGTRLFSHLQSWLRKAESTWREKRGEKADKMSIYERLDYQKGLTSQSSKTRFKVTYNTSGTYLVSCIIQNGPRQVAVDSISLDVAGTIAESTTYFFDTDDEDEALYVCGFFNSPTLDKLMKPMQSKGGFGERHIHKKVLEWPIPKFDPKNVLHIRLKEISRNCQVKIKRRLSDISEGYTSVGKIRQLVKEELEPEIAEIDTLAKRILVEVGMSAKSLTDYAT